MQKLRRGLALLLTALMLVTLLPATALAAETEGQEVMSLTEQSAPTAETSAYSSAARTTTTVDRDFNLMPMEKYSVTINLQGYLPEELAKMPLSTLLTEGSISPKEGDKVVLIQDGVSTILEQDATVDLTKGWNGWDNIYLQLIVGNGDQLNPNANTGYDVTIYASAEDNLFDGTKVYSVGESAAELTVNNVYYMPDYSYDENGQPIGVTEISVRTDAGWDGSETKVQLGLDSWNDYNQSMDGLSMEVYTGYYRTQAELDAAVAAGTSTKVEAGGHQADYSNWREVGLTAVLSRSSGVVAVRPMYVYLYVPSDHVSESGLMNNRGSSVYRTSSSYTDDTLGIRVREYRLSSGNAVDNTYYFRLWYYQNNTLVENPEAYVCSYVGNFSTLAEAQASGAQDITSELFSSQGYDANYSGDGVIFSVFKEDGTVLYQRKIVALPYVEEVASAPVPNASKDTYFYVDGATVVKKYSAEDAEKYQQDTYTITCDTWVMPGDVDGYYYGYPGADVNYGCQTVFLLDEDGEKAIAADEDGTVTFLPTFFQGNGVTVYAGHNGNSGTEQKSGETTVTTPWGEAVQYSAAAADGKALKNYWVTFVTQEEGPKLYVNAADITAAQDKDGNPVRQVYLDSAHDYYHDVFISNIGDAELSNLKVELSADAQNVQLDEYWTVQADSVGKLAPFTIAEKDKMANIARIRLVAKRDANGNVVTGVVSGTLTISAKGQESVVIKLEGSAGVERIVTDTLDDGVKYVPYAGVIQTSAMGSSNAVQFTLPSGNDSLPEGFTLLENGTIYGVPMEYGTFTFTVEAYFTQSGNRETKTFTLQILDNTDENVRNATDKGYDVLNSVPEVLESYTDQVFRSNGEYNEFFKFFLDGQELERGVDYEATNGSTKITIRAQTFRDAGTGTHTIAAEFRTDKSDASTVKKAAQNYTVPGSSSGGGGSAGDGPPKPSVKPGTGGDTQKPDTSSAIFQDVSTNDWFYSDVEWAYQEKLMIGVSEDLYAPDKAITSAMVVTVLARLDGVDLTAYEGAKYPQIEAGQWYTSAANWAMEMQLLEGESFDVNAPVARGDFAEMLVKYLRHAGIDCTLPENLTAFADADLMTEAENDAFQVLYDFGIFKGVGGYRMDPQGSTTRAQLAALLHRLSVFVENQK